MLNNVTSSTQGNNPVHSDPPCLKASGYGLYGLLSMIVIPAPLNGGVANACFFQGINELIQSLAPKNDFITSRNWKVIAGTVAMSAIGGGFGAWIGGKLGILTSLGSNLMAWGVVHAPKIIPEKYFRSLGPVQPIEDYFSSDQIEKV